MIAPAQRSSRPRKAKQQPGDEQPGKAGLRESVDHLLSLKIEYVGNPLFDQPDAQVEILGPPPLPIKAPGPHESSARRGLTPYFLSLYDTPLLDGDAEAYLFRKMNYLKHQAAQWVAGLKQRRPSARRVSEIETALAEAAEIKNRLVEANLRLVVSIAKRFVDPSSDLQELISDGNVSLIRSVEKFDYALGYKFSTYATYAIRRNFFRSVIRDRKARRRYLTGDGEFANDTASAPPLHALSESQYGTLQETVGRLMARLNDRERLILSLRFGFGETASAETLSEIARKLGVCKERIRQIQTRAMQKLNQLVKHQMIELTEFV